MKPRRWLSLFAVPVWAGVVAAATDNAPTQGARAPGSSSGAAKALPRPDLTTQGASAKLPMFIVRNVGSAQAATSIVQIECRTQSSNVPCQADRHYVNLPTQTAPPLPAGTHMTAPHLWRVPTPSLAPAAEMKFALGVWPTASEAAGLKFRICADIALTVLEASESNNCSEFVFVKSP
jgi:hypothetical protein